SHEDKPHVGKKKLIRLDSVAICVSRWSLWCDFHQFWVDKLEITAKIQNYDILMASCLYKVLPLTGYLISMHQDISCVIRTGTSPFNDRGFLCHMTSGLAKCAYFSNKSLKVLIVRSQSGILPAQNWSHRTKKDVGDVQTSPGRSDVPDVPKNRA
ncbi:hypothetical protein KI387_002434, partial [Taxus chinensis]